MVIFCFENINALEAGSSNAPAVRGRTVDLPGRFYVLWRY